MTINSKSWQNNSDGWVDTMNKSKKEKEEYKEYLIKNSMKEVLPYREWLREKNND